MTEYMPYVWLGLAVVLAILELCTSQLVSIWFVIGAVAASVCSAFFFDSVIWQVVVFILVSALALVLTRPLVKKIKKTTKVKTNSDRNIGKIAVVVIDINNQKSSGMVEVDGARWTARSLDGSVITAGTTVRVEEIQGVKLIVTPEAKEREE